jgi:hypothetical protein
MMVVRHVASIRAGPAALHMGLLGRVRSAHGSGMREGIPVCTVRPPSATNAAPVT